MFKKQMPNTKAHKMEIPVLQASTRAVTIPATPESSSIASCKSLSWIQNLHALGLYKFSTSIPKTAPFPQTSSEATPCYNKIESNIEQWEEYFILMSDERFVYLKQEQDNKFSTMYPYQKLISKLKLSNLDLIMKLNITKSLVVSKGITNYCLTM